MKPHSILRWCCLSLWLNVGFLASCQSPVPVRPFVIDVQVIDDEQLSVADARLIVSKQKQITREDGFARFTPDGHEGEVVSIALQCPPAWRTSPKNADHVRLRSLTTTDGKQYKPEQVTLMCIPDQKIHVIIVQTNVIPNLPINLLGKEITQTDETGLAQFTVSGRPGDMIEVMLDTSSNPTLSPQMPRRQIQLPSRRRFLVFDQSFTFASAVLKNKKHRTRPSRSTGPRRL